MQYPLGASVTKDDLISQMFSFNYHWLFYHVCVVLGDWVVQGHYVCLESSNGKLGKLNVCKKMYLTLLNLGFRHCVSLNSLCLAVSHFVDRVHPTPPHPNLFWKPITDMDRKDTQIFFFLTRFNKIAIQGTPQMAVDKEAIICLSRVYSYYSKCNFPLFYVYPP